MAHPDITSNAQMTAAAFVLSRAAHRYQKLRDAAARESGNVDGISDLLAAALDRLDADVEAIQSRIATDGLLLVNLLVASAITSGRLDLSLGDTLNTNGTDFALSAGWGDAAAVGAGSVVGTAARWYMQIVPGGVGFSANPTVTLTYPAARTFTPTMAIPVLRNYNSAGGITGITVDFLSTTICRLQVIGTPVDAEPIELDCLVIG